MTELGFRDTIKDSADLFYGFPRPLGLVSSNPYMVVFSSSWHGAWNG